MKKVVSTKNGPYSTVLKANEKYMWCSCGLSERQPFCDGSHKASGSLLPVKICVSEDTYIRLCGCKKTKNPPYCDNSHLD